MFFGYLVSSSKVENRKVGIWLSLAENLIFAFPSTYFLVDIKNEANSSTVLPQCDFPQSSDFAETDGNLEGLG